ncbi:MAG TPA: VOC family protein [bacterium]|nr:VOC family protein [bacterium]
MAAKPDPRPEGTAWINPYLTCRSVEAALDFYERAFGFRKIDAVPGPDGKIMHATMGWKDGVLMMCPESDMNPMKAPVTSGALPPFTLYVYCEDVDKLCAQAKSAGAKIQSEPQDMFWGDRTCNLIDPEGYYWWFATNVGGFDAEAMQKMMKGL